MSRQIKGCYPMKVEEITFTDGQILKDKIVFVSGDLLIVDGENDGPPTIYNMRFVEALRRVEEIRPAPRAGVVGRI